MFISDCNFCSLSYSFSGAIKSSLISSISSSAYILWVPFGPLVLESCLAAGQRRISSPHNIAITLKIPTRCLPISQTSKLKPHLPFMSVYSPSFVVLRASLPSILAICFMKTSLQLNISSSHLALLCVLTPEHFHVIDACNERNNFDRVCI